MSKTSHQTTERMKRFSGTYLVESFLDYYANIGHTICPSSPLVPDDPTLLFTAAGMVPFKAYYSDPSTAPYPTATSVQKCLRAGGKQSDLENVGRTLRHHTFFEMLGNFSFGDYFKKGAIDTAWDLSVNVWSIDKDRIWISVFLDDDEAYDLWAKRIGIPASRIVRLGKSDNFWGPVGDTGICGPSSELYYDTGEARSCGKPDCQPGCDCDRFIEYWNLVFPQFFLTEKGNYDLLPKPGIDTGMGLERLAFILQEVEDNYHTDLFLPIRNAVQQALPEGEETEKAALAVNAASDHVRALVFALSEGIRPSNEGRGYVLRRLLRRALIKMHPFGVKQPFLAPAVDAVIDTMGGRYPELKQRAGFVKKVITAEEEHFLSTIEQGWDKLQGVFEKGRRSKDRVIPGSDAFTLHDTFGIHIEMTTELAEDARLTVDTAGFEAAMAAQKERSRKVHNVAMTTVDGDDSSVAVELQSAPPTEFVGYDRLSCDANVTASWVVSKDRVEFVTNETVFYPESGGQIGDTGIVRVSDQTLEVIDAFRKDGHTIHVVRAENGKKGLSAADVNSLFDSKPSVHLEVDRETRLSTKRNHTATHLLHAALRRVLGDHVTQAGSLVAPDRLRFDFHHFQPMADDEVEKVTRMVNDAILDDRSVSWKIIPYKQAITDGAMALFGEKYPENVRMVTVDGLSKELCGGTHLDHTGEIGPFLIRQETAVAAGVRRIEALTGRGALDHFKAISNEREEMARYLRIAPEDLTRRVHALAEENEALKKRLSEEESKQATGQLADALSSAEDINGIAFVSYRTDSGDLGALRNAGDYLRGKLDPGIGLLCLATGKKPVALVVVSDRLMNEQGVKANAIAKRVGEELSLRGGGKDHMAQLGLGDAKDFERIKASVKAWLKDRK